MRHLVWVLALIGVTALFVVPACDPDPENDDGDRSGIECDNGCFLDLMAGLAVCERGLQACVDRCGGDADCLADCDHRYEGCLDDAEGEYPDCFSDCDSCAETSYECHEQCDDRYDDEQMQEDCAVACDENLVECSRWSEGCFDACDAGLAECTDACAEDDEVCASECREAYADCQVPCID